MKRLLLIFSLMLFGAAAPAQDVIPITSSVNAKIEAAESIPNALNSELRRRIFFRVSTWTSFWENPKVTPEEICATMGTKAKALFTASALDSKYLRDIAALAGVAVGTFLDEKYLSPKAGFSVSFATDGTATITRTEP